MALRTPTAELPAGPERIENIDASIFDAAGFLDPATATERWRAVLEQLPQDSALLRLLPEAWEVLGRAADPDLALLK